ncbi:MAG: hypothetical protein ACK2U9_14605 [Anaerolineae bacterium]
MSGIVLRSIIALAFAFHGVGHAMGIIPALGIVNVEGASQDWLKNWSSHSWLLTDLLGDTVSRILCIGLYGAALIGFLAAALALLGWGVPHDWWRTLAVVSSVISLVALLLFWNALIFLFPHKVGALTINVITLVCLLVLSWPTEAALGF